MAQSGDGKTRHGMNSPPNVDKALTERWQKGEASVNAGAVVIQTAIERALAENRGCLIGRHGTIELTALLLEDAKTMRVDNQRLFALEINAGVFPYQYIFIKDWLQAYKDASMSADVMAVAWHAPLARAEWSLLDRINPNATRIPLRSIEPYYCRPTHHWTRALAGQRVCVVSSFADLMEGQLESIQKVWPQCDTIVPKTASWSFVRSFYCPKVAKGKCQWPEGVNSWLDAVGLLEQEVMKTGARIVLIGCGGLAMPLAARLKQKGCICIVMGGAIQILFGIKGRRWETHPVISQYFNDDWIFPPDDMIPDGAGTVEGGCYW
jgi:hypothetical protein